MAMVFPSDGLTIPNCRVIPGVYAGASASSAPAGRLVDEIACDTGLTSPRDNRDAKALEKRRAMVARDADDNAALPFGRQLANEAAHHPSR